jgi:hypothetical protein
MQLYFLRRFAKHERLVLHISQVPAHFVTAQHRAASRDTLPLAVPGSNRQFFIPDVRTNGQDVSWTILSGWLGGAYSRTQPTVLPLVVRRSAT